MTEYLTNYMNTVENRMKNCGSLKELERILSEHLDKIEFMQHERIVHFLVTLMFAVILCIFICATVFSENLMFAVLDVIIMVLLGFYIKHYYFLENTVQKMYKVYDELIKIKYRMEDTDGQKENCTAFSN